MKKILIPSSLKQIDNTLNYVDGYILSIEDFSVNAPIYFDKKQIEEILESDKYKNKELFISLNKNIHEKDLEKLEKIMKNLSKYNIKGVLYYDVSLVEINKRLDNKLPLIWAQEHLTTNADTCNFWHSQGVDMVLLSSELTIDEILEIHKKTDMKCMTTVFGYLPMFVSARHTIKNYCDYSNTQEKKEIYTIEKEGKSYPIVDNNDGTNAYSSSILNGLREYNLLNKIGMEYGVFNSLLIENDEMLKVLEIFNKNQDDEVLEKEIEELFNGNIDKGFFYKETIYKVKKND